MRLRVNNATANEELVSLVNEGYAALSEMQVDYKRRKDEGTYDDSEDVVTELLSPVQSWADRVDVALRQIFPTPLEANLFGDPEIPFGTVSGDYKYQSALSKCRYFVRGLNQIRLQGLPE